jgi:tetratricopeptide (TPR) repeat protein
MKKTMLLTTVFVLIALCAAAFSPQSAQDLFQKALTKERAEGNLEEAITLYQRVAEESADEALAANAQLRIGICYEKLGIHGRVMIFIWSVSLCLQMEQNFWELIFQPGRMLFIKILP